jgi:predicted DNA-binding mobile mystery protein A
MPDFMQRRRLTRLLDRSAEQVEGLQAPEGGWITAMRRATGLPVDLIARRKGVSRNAVYQAERSEKDGAISLKQMEKIAAAMGGRFVYAIVPDEPVEAMRYKQALRRARALARDSGEFQGLSGDDRQDWIEDKAAELLHDMPPDFWTGAEEG